MAQDILSREDLRKGLDYQRETGAKLGEALVTLDLVSEEQLADALSTQRGLDVVNLADLYPNPAAVSLLTEKFVRARQAIPIDFRDSSVVLAMSNPLDVITIDDVRIITGKEVIPVVATSTSILDTIDYLYAHKGRLNGSGDGETEGEGSLEEEELAQDFSVVTLVDEVLDTALKRRASDVHLEPQADGLVIRLRVDGVLHHLTTVPISRRPGIISRIKILGDMDIAEKRLPQDGRATYVSDDREVDLRIASIPTVHGENITIRLLEVSMFSISLEDLGMQPKELEILRNIIQQPHGQVLITGPTGSGKSTTLYAALEELNQPGVKIYTVEDPVERKMSGILQTQTKAGIGLTFAAALRSLVRSDPDIIMIGEIRDYETALIATEASLTGHLVLSTLHTNDAPSTVSRLLEMGLPPYLIASSLECVVAQRLARKLCHFCAEKLHLNQANMTAADREFFGRQTVEVRRPVGCRRCFNTGYSGRIGLFEVLPISKEIRQLILNQATADEVREAAHKGGMKTLREDGVQKVLSGITSVEEVQRVTM
ncbi:MAG: type II/IV secretion system protein [Actinobacteria bacterium]|nr:type II/IV secretion system protein [Actinomycetota bacterium]